MEGGAVCSMSHLSVVSSFLVFTKYLTFDLNVCFLKKHYQKSPRISIQRIQEPLFGLLIFLIYLAAILRRKNQQLCFVFIFILQQLFIYAPATTRKKDKVW